MGDSQNWFDQGFAFLEKGNYTEAITAFDKAITFSQSQKDAWFNRGLAFAQMGNYLKAIQSFDQTLSLDPDYENAKKAKTVVLARVENQKNTTPAPVAAPPFRDSYVQASATAKTVPSPSKESIRNPVFAVLFSFLFPGWGQWYNGRRWAGLVFLVVSVILSVLNIALRLVLIHYQIVLTIIFMVLGLGIWIYGMYDAYTTAESINRGEIGFTRKSRLFWLPPVILVLMIVITILLAAVIAAFVFGMAGNIQHTKVVAATVQQMDASHIVVTYQGGQDANQVSRIIGEVMDSKGSSQTKTLGQPGDTTPVKVGSTLSFTGTPGKDHVIATAKFMDGTNQVILDTYV
jgi:FlaG/FlaF family flagellin (archaellin)